MPLSVDKLYGDADFLFQRVFAPVHRAKTTSNWITDHSVIVLDWSANSSDLNPIENLWNIVNRKMRDTRPKKTEKLRAAIKETWASVTRQQCHRLSLLNINISVL